MLPPELLQNVIPHVIIQMGIDGAVIIVLEWHRGVVGLPVGCYSGRRVRKEKGIAKEFCGREKGAFACLRFELSSWLRRYSTVLHCITDLHSTCSSLLQWHISLPWPNPTPTSNHIY